LTCLNKIDGKYGPFRHLDILALFRYILGYIIISMKLKRTVSKYTFYHVSTDGIKSSHSIERKKKKILRIKMLVKSPFQITEEYVFKRKTKYLFLLTTIYLLHI
jgi:hypothetical protein